MMPQGTPHLVEQDGIGVLFRKEDLSVSLIQLKLGDRAEHQDQHLSHSSNDFCLSLRENASKGKSQPDRELVQAPIQQSDGSRPTLDRLTLTISNTCNLRCSYCYASGGTYYNVNGLMMTRETALNALNHAARAYSYIGHINFFGGEPTLNRDIIELVCEYARYLHEKGVLLNLPSFGITTNGYAISDRMIEILTGYGFNVTLSLDGPKEVHDFKRPTKAGGGSYDIVVRNAKRLLEHGLDVEFECTYSADHLKLGIEITSLMDFFYDGFSCRTLHCPIVSASPDSKEFIPLSTCIELQGDAIEYSLLNLANGVPKTVSTAIRLLNSLVTKIPIWNYCPAGRKEVTVNADGNLYACFMLMQSDSYSFGSVNAPTVTPQHDRGFWIRGKSPCVGTERGVIERLIADADKYTNAACGKCWAQPMCHGCLGEDFDRYSGRVTRSDVSGVSGFCDYKRSMVERFFRGLARASIRLHPS